MQWSIKAFTCISQPIDYSILHEEENGKLLFSLVKVSKNFGVKRREKSKKRMSLAFMRISREGGKKHCRWA